MKSILKIVLFLTPFFGLIVIIALRDKINPILYVFLAIPVLVGLVSRRLFLGGRIAEPTVNIEKKIDENLKKLKSVGEPIKLDFDKCEFIDNSYSHEVNQNISGAEMLSHNSTEILKVEDVNQSALIYRHVTGTSTEKFTQAFPLHSDALKFYMLNNNVTLYVDRFDRTKYFFDLKN